MSSTRPELEVQLRSLKIIAKGQAAVNAVKWPVAVAIIVGSSIAAVGVVALALNSPRVIAWFVS